MIDYGQRQTDAVISQMDRVIAGIYRQTEEELQKKLDDYLARFRVKDAIKREMLRKGEITLEEYNYWRTGQIMIGKRWEEMRDVIAQDLHNANNLARSVVYGHTPEVYALNHNYATFQVEKASLVDTSYTLYDRQTVERIMRSNPDLLPPPGPRKKAEIAAGKDIKWQSRQLQSVMTKSILAGDSIPHIAKRLSNELSVTNRKAAERYARTAATGAQNAGRVDAYKRAEDMGIEVEQEWLATLDPRTRDAHRQLDGQHVPVGEPFKIDGEEIRFPGDPAAPGYLIWNCRCTLVPRLKSLDQSDAPRNSKLGDMSYDEWKNEHIKFQVEVPDFQSAVGRAISVDQINDLMNGQGWFRTNRAGITSETDLTGCDLESAKSIASTYQQVFDKYPQLKGQFDAPNAQPVGMNNNTYAWCYIRNGGQVQVNPNKYNSWQSLVKLYESDVASGWHPYGTTAESIVTHELGHAIDGLLAQKGILGGYTSSGEFRYASSSLKTTVMNRAAKQDPDIASWVNGDKRQREYAIQKFVSTYASKNPREWFAECFAEYITSANPRTVAAEFGKELEKLLGRLT